MTINTGTLTGTITHDQGVIQLDLGSIVPLLHHYCPISLVERLSLASTVIRNSIMRGEIPQSEASLQSIITSI